MSLQQNRRISFSDMNRSLTVTNGNTGIGTTSPAHMLDVNGGVRSTNFTTTNALITNVTTGTLNASTGITAATAQITNINATTSSAATAVATTYTGGSMSLSGNLSIGGTLTTVNITTTNISETNVSAGTVSATNIAVTTQTVGTSRITTSLLALGNSNTIGNIFTTGGNVGIGTSSPLTTLDVRGNIVIPMSSRLTLTATDNFSYSGNVVGHYSLSWNTDPSFAGGSMSYLSGYGGIRLFTTGAPRMNILNNGNVGINTESPTTQLSVNGDFSLAANSGAWNTTAGKGLFMRYSTAGGQDGAFIQSIDRSTSTVYPLSLVTQTFSVETNSVNRLHITSSGNVGIGTSTPRSNLEISQSSSTTGVMLYSGLNDGGVNSIIFNHSDQSLNYRKVAIQTQALGGGLAARANLGLCVNIGNDNTNATMSDAKLFISGLTGNVGIGTTNPSTLLQANTGSTVLMQLNTAGRLSVLDDVIAFASFSDSRLKTDIQTVSQSDAVDVVNALRPVTFKWKDTISNVGKRGVLDIGFIAQEVEAIAPYAVDEFTDMADNVEYKRIKHERLLPYLVGTIQHLTQSLSDLKNEFDDFKKSN